MGTVACFVLPILVIAIVLFARAAERRAAEKRLMEAGDRYRAALAKLKKEPTSATLKESALALGREYASYARKSSVTVFDELALGNDLSAATAGAFAAAVTAAPAPTSSVEERLRQLEGLRQKGLITDAEYATRRTALINSV